jgi:hypothetical protein
MDQLVVEDEFVIRVQAPVASSQKQIVYCSNCGSGFANQANLMRHEETKHADQTTPESVAKRLQLKEYRKTNGRERRKNDHVYREKMQQTCRTYRMKRKAREAAEGCGHAGGLSNVLKPNEVSISVDIPEDPPLREESDHVLGVNSSVGKPRTTDKPNGVFQVTTTGLTNENITEFFTPKWSAPRTKEQRL